MDHIQNLTTQDKPNYDLLIKYLKDDKAKIFSNTGIND